MLGVVGNEVQGIGLLMADSPVWSGKSSSERFVLMMGGESVNDSTTGLIWEQSPDAFHGVWSESSAHCEEKTIGGRKGWRLPTVKELASLADHAQHDPALPPGHPFPILNLPSFGRPHRLKPTTSWPGT